MAIFHRSKIENQVEFKDTNIVKTQRDMKIVWPKFTRAIVSSIEFILFTVILGLGCLSFSYVITRIVSFIK